MDENKVIVWEKWSDPFGFDEEPQNVPFNEEDNLDEETQIKTDHIRCQIISTPFGIIPINENTASGKIFNFWTGHANFPITKKIAEIIENTDGVETLNIFTKYRFRIAIGKAFKDSIIMRKINNNINTYLESNNYV
jgi:hypothetical protein